MFCPGCGTSETRPLQYCRTCGADLGSVRTSMAQPDLITARAAAAREEIGRAFAERIREVEDIEDLEDLLPQFEKFLESPPERRLRQIRAGVITAMTGLGVTIAILVVTLFYENVLLFAGSGVLVFLIGLGIVLNGLYFTVPGTGLKSEGTGDPGPDKAIESASKDRLSAVPETLDSRAIRPESVTEGTTRHLTNEL